MVTMAENVIAAGSENRPSMLEKGIDIKAVNILLLGLPVDIYNLINHYQTTKEIWDHVKELMEDYDDKARENAIFMENMFPVGSINGDTVELRYDSDILSEVPHYDTYQESDMFNSNVQDMGYIENIVSNNESYDEITSNNNVISYVDYMVTIGNDIDNYIPPPVQKNDMILSVIEQMKSQV
ncbi:hypothetical protein Tco_0591482 [Tanacetum coccineum]